MGSLTSRPKALPVQQPEIITISAPTTTDTTSATTTATGTTGSTTTTDTSATSADDTTDTATTTRSGNLLERTRGLLSTVLTGFTGVLNQTTTPQRKSLLGE